MAVAGPPEGADNGPNPEAPCGGCGAVPEAVAPECRIQEDEGGVGHQQHQHQQHLKQQQHQQRLPSSAGNETLETGGDTCSSSAPGTAAAAPAGPTATAAIAAVATLAAAAVAAAEVEDEELGRRAPPPDSDVDSRWNVSGDTHTHDRTPLPEDHEAMSAAGPRTGGAGGGETDGYLDTAAAAVAAMTAKPSSGWGWGSAGGGGGDGAAAAAGCRTAAGGGRATAVKDYHLEPRGGGGGGGGGGVFGSDDAGPNANETDAALRALLGECRHVIEVYGLTTEIRTSHLQEFVSEFASQVDQELFQLRPFAEASAASQAVAAAELLPPRERPKTTAAVAKRLLSHALGMSQLRDKEAERNLAQQRKARAGCCPERGGKRREGGECGTGGGKGGRKGGGKGGKAEVVVATQAEAAREARQERERKVAAAWDDD
ncbi:hypothetical protein VOLCADRAFT_92049 [Volvox carteri f. nagariensis]|uniref:Uncharacterized protein n=1 Tax=Volvox carteri f. nagariensis TaxID=3068 RepID=D8TYZ3_VOLCA|nr:uncharacterized protein VOLCADRAFT_92049 [Volvox carteri f. nagariensis]EFJ47303.1 hypothetical protein VOLCADRAFT_92049 [Volvox carteri f. nagariensis]|eukprot:XP_002951492.1 hypothetical protein VOLCADRAFT_92049 [Volvox carteri f. nagariensis]